MNKLISSTSLKYFFIVIAIIICQPFSSLASSQTSKQCDEVFQNAKWKEVGDEYSTNKKNSPKYLSRSDGSATKVDVLLENAFTPLLEKMANDVKAFDKTKLRQSIQARYRNTSQYRPIPYVHRSFPATQFKKLATILNEIGSLANEDIPWQDFDKSPNRYWKVPGHNHTFYYAKNAYQAYLDYKSGKTQSIIVVPKNYKKNNSEEKWKEVSNAILIANEKIKLIESELIVFWEAYSKNFSEYTSFRDSLDSVLRTQSQNGDDTDFSGLQPYKQFDFAEIPENSPPTSGSFYQMPLGVGTYGSIFNQKLRITALVLIDLVKENLLPMAQEMENLTGDLILEQTVRGMEGKKSKGGVTPETLPPSIRATIEGIITLVQLLKFTMGKAQPDLGTPSDIIKQILTPLQEKPNSLIVYLTRYTRSFLIGPSGLKGYYFPDTFARSTNGDLMLSATFKSYLIRVMNDSVKEADHSRAALPRKHRAAVGTPCPVSCHTSGITGIQYLAQAFLEVFKIVDEELPRHANFKHKK